MVAPLSRMVATNYRNLLIESTAPLANRLRNIVQGRVVANIDMVPINGARKVYAAVLFFDIRGFTARTASDDFEMLKNTLFMLNIVMPAMMRVVFRHGGYIEKNTGDGLMAILGLGQNPQDAANTTVSCAAEMMYVLHHIANPILQQNGVQLVDARIGVDMGPILVARIGVATGSADHPRSTLTAVGPAANRASKLQGLAGTNEIWCGDAIRISCGQPNLHLFTDVTPAGWGWTHGGNAGAIYRCWNYEGRTRDPFLAIPAGR